MADEVFTPHASEPIFDSTGQFSVRWMSFFNSLTESSNTTAISEETLSTLNAAFAAIGSIQRRVNDIELLSSINDDGKLVHFEKEIERAEIDLRRYALLVS